MQFDRVLDLFYTSSTANRFRPRPWESVALGVGAETVVFGGRFMALRLNNIGGDFLSDPIEPLLGVDRAAHLLGISTKTLRDWIQYRKIDYVKVGSRVMIRPETIRSYVATNTRRAEAG
jgi:excisionase family DNA binding protein